jgi:agmatinase
LTYEQAVYLIQRVKDSGKNIIGFDLNEVSPGDEINGIVGARILMELCLAAY